MCVLKYQSQSWNKFRYTLYDKIITTHLTIN